MDDPQKRHTKWKEPVAEDHMLYDRVWTKDPEQVNPQGADQRLSGAGGARRWGEIAQGYAVPFADDENVLKVGSGDDCTTLNVSQATDFYT